MTNNRKEFIEKLIRTYSSTDEQGQVVWIAEYRKIFI